MATGFAAEAARIRDVGMLSVADIARATGADDSTVRAWLAESRAPSGERAERLAELSAVVERLVGVVRPDYAKVWVRKPNPMLADEKPLDLIASGGYRDVLRVISALEDSAVS
jgi:uncharacterized protein (DUF2384 family)